MKFFDKTKNEPPIQAVFENARSFMDANDLERKRRRREDRRRSVVKWIGGFLAFLGINGSFIILANMSGIIELLFDQWRLWPTLAGFMLSALYVGYAAFFIITFFWISDKTGFNFWIEDWIDAWDTWDISGSHNILKFNEFPRKERRALVRDLDKVLNNRGRSCRTCIANAISTVAVGMPVTRHPPHRSGLEELPHPAPASGNNAQTLLYRDWLPNPAGNSVI